MAMEFAAKIKDITEVIELGIVGSLARGGESPRDCDMAVLMDDFSEIGNVARAARKMCRVSQHWVVFVFDSRLGYRGRICRRKDYPATSVECYVSGCGDIPHLKVIRNFKFKEKVFLAEKAEIIFAQKESLVLKKRKETFNDVSI